MIAVALAAAGTMNSEENDVKNYSNSGYAPAATPTQITAAINSGIAWLAGKQNPDGSWGAGVNEVTGITALVLIKLQDYAYETASPSTWDGPFDTDYTYYNNVRDGWEYLFTPQVPPNNGIYVKKQLIGLQEHPIGSGHYDNPDTNANGYGIYLGLGSSSNQGRVYHTGIFLMALVASGAPSHVNEGLIDFDGSGPADTFGEIAQEVVDWLAFAQGDANISFSCGRGGYSYVAIDNYWYDYNGRFPDNSVSGYAYLGLIGAEAVLSPHPGTSAVAFACTVPDWVKNECKLWVQYIQYTGSTLKYHGGSAYNLPTESWVKQINLLKTGNLLAEMTFCGLQNDLRFVWALEYIERTWHEKLLTVDPEFVTGWGYQTDHTPPCTDPAEYQTMFCLMKGFGYSGINEIDLSGLGGDPKQDWYNVETPHSPQYNDFASVLVAQQNTDGSWPVSPYSLSDPGMILSTTWALCTLEKIPNYPQPDVWKNDNLGEEKCVKQCHYINYTICVHNPSQTNYLHNVVITDPLPDEESFVDASPGYSISGRTITWNIGNITVNQSTVCVWLLVLVRPETTNGTIIHNEALVTSSDTGSVYAVENTPVCGGCCLDVKIKGGFGVSVEIQNNCPDNITNLNWTITVDGGLVISGHQKSGTITMLAPGGSTTVKSFVFGFGKITITVIVDDCPPFIATAFMLGPFVLGVQQIPHSSYEYYGCGC